MSVRTVLGDVPAASLGTTYLHEHFIIDGLLVEERMPEIHLASVDRAVADLVACAAAGLGAAVDTIPAACGRGPRRLAAISRASGVAIIATTGLHTARFYTGHRWALEASPERLAELFIADIEEGIDRYDYTGPVVERTPHRAGILKVATLGEAPDDRERRLFTAAAIAHHQTGAPILTHCENGRGAIAQIELLLELEIPLSRVVLSHTDKVEDHGYHLDILGSGVNVEYDQPIRHASTALPATVPLIAAMVDAGHTDQLMLGTDGARQSLLTSYGGFPGLAWLLTGFVALLDAAGVTADTRRRFFVDNPARLLDFSDPTA
jgi:phosphotriesterase-related protein